MDNLYLQNLTSDDIQKIEDFRKSKQTAVLAILFSDIVESSSAVEKLGETSYARLRHIHDDLFVSIMCRENAGVVIKEIGDSFLCVFAEPSTAVLRAIEFQRAINSNKEHLTNQGYTITVKIGIHLGQVVVENTFAKDIFGSHVNRAARIESIANGGQILTSHAIWDNAVGWIKDRKEEKIGWVLLGKTQLKGIQGKTEIYEFYPNETGPRSLPKVFRKQKQTRIKIALLSLLILSAIIMLAIKIIGNKDNHEKTSSTVRKRIPYYVQFDSVFTTGENKQVQDALLAEVITALYPDSVVTEVDLKRLSSAQGRLYNKRDLKSYEDQYYFSDSLNLNGALVFRNLVNKEDSTAFEVALSFWTQGYRAFKEHRLSSKTSDLKSYFRIWFSDELRAFRLRHQQGVVLESNESELVFALNSDGHLSEKTPIRLQRSYFGKEGLKLWLEEYDKKINYLKDKPRYLNILKKEEAEHLNREEMRHDLTEGTHPWSLKIEISGLVEELHDSVGKASWRNVSVYPFLKPQKGDRIFIDY